MEPNIVQKLHEAAREKPLARRTSGLMHETADMLEAIFQKFPEAKDLVPLKYKDHPWKGIEP